MHDTASQKSEFPSRNAVSDLLRIKAAFAIAEMLRVLVSFIFGSIWRYRIGVIQGNLRYIFPESSAREHAMFTAGYYRHLSRLLTSSLILHHMNRNNLDKFVGYDGIEELNAVWADGRDAVLMASHFGNWEYLLSLPLFTPFQVVAVCARIKNPLVQKKMTRLRSKYGAKLVYKEDFYRYVLSRKKRTPTLYVVIADQRPSGLSKQCVNFFGRNTMIQTGAERIAKHLNCPVFYADVVAGTT